VLIAVGDSAWVPRGAIDQLKARALELVGAHHKAAPLDPGLKLQTLREQLAALAGADATEKVLGLLTGSKPPGLLIAGDSARLPSFRGAEADAAAGKALDRGRRALVDAALEGTSENAMTELLGGDVKVTRAVLAKLVRDAEAIKAGSLWFAKPAVDRLEAQIRAHLEAEGRLTIAQLKDMTGLGRKQTIPLLEHFDRERVTKRDGSDRIKGGR
jgi:selenocysteine-specific elongation factor